jgi:hypothetical protein
LGGRSSLILEVGSAAEPGGNLFVFKTGVVNFVDAEAVHQKFAFSDDVNVVTIIEESDAGRAVGNGAVAEELRGERGNLFFDDYLWNWFRLLFFQFPDFLFGGLRFWNFSAEDIASTALIFGLASPLDAILMETGVFHGKELGILGRGAGIGGYDRLVTIEIKITDDDQDQQKYDEYDELFLLLHAAVLK